MFVLSVFLDGSTWKLAVRWIQVIVGVSSIGLEKGRSRVRNMHWSIGHNPGQGGEKNLWHSSSILVTSRLNRHCLVGKGALVLQRYSFQCELAKVRFPTVIVDECTQAAETAALAPWQPPFYRFFLFVKGVSWGSNCPGMPTGDSDWRPMSVTPHSRLAWMGSSNE